MFKRLAWSLTAAYASAASIAEEIGSNPALGSLNGVLGTGDYTALVTALSSAGNYTLFAPNNAAWAGVSTSDVPAITATLYYHALGANVPSTALSTTPTFAETLLTNASYVSKNGAGQTLSAAIINGNAMINGATVVTADIVCDNGVIHIIDSVLVVPGLTSATATAAGLDTLVANVVATNLVETVDETPAITVFAPVDAAFDMIDQGLSTSQVSQVLQSHVVTAGAVFSTSLSDGDTFTTANGKTLSVRIVGDDVFINNAKVVTANVITKNAVVHVLENVISTVTIAEQIGLETDLSALGDVLSSGDYEGIVTAFSSPGSFTLFAPKSDGIPSSLPDIATTTQVLYYHALASQVMSADLSTTPLFPNTLMADAMYVNKGGAGQLLSASIVDGTAMINDASVITADIQCSNGVIHVISKMLTLPELTSTTATAAGLTTLVDKVVATSLTGVVDETPSITVFAPLNEAFTAAGMIADADLANTLANHIVNATAFSTDLSDGDELTTLAGEMVTVSILNGVVTVGGAKVVTPNVITKNAVVHVIDGVLVPPVAPTSAAAPTESESSGTAATQPAAAMTVLGLLLAVALVA